MVLQSNSNSLLRCQLFKMQSVMKAKSMKLKNILAVICLMFLTGCLTTPYQSLGGRGGYKTVWIGPDVINVSVAGNAMVGYGRLRDYALLQAADQAEARHFTYFTYHRDLRLVNAYSRKPVEKTRRIATMDTKDRWGFPKHFASFKLFRTLPKGLVKGQYFEVTEVQHEMRAKYGIQP